MKKQGNIELSAWIIMAPFLISALQTTPVWAGDEDHPSTGKASTEMPAHASGMRVYRDPATGKIGPPPAGFQPPGLSIAEEHMLNRTGHGLRERTLPNGAVAVDLQGRFRNMTIATTDAEGKAAVNCTHTTSEANAVLQSAVPAQDD
jgi:hypothetical protein